METLYCDGKPIGITLTDLERKLARTILDLSLGEGDFDLCNRNIALFEQDPEVAVYGCDLVRIHLIEWKDRQQLGALLTSLEKKHVVYMDEDPDYGNYIWYSPEVLKELTA